MVEINKVLVTGGAGFIGSHLCERLLYLGKYVVCIDNFNDYYDPKIKEKNIVGLVKSKNFCLYREDITDFEKLKEIFKKEKPGLIIHLAARAGVRASFESQKIYQEVNVEGTKNLLDLAKESKIGFIFGSSSSVYGTNKKIPFSETDPTENTISPYAKTKKEAEILCRSYSESYGMKIICLRFFTVYGPRGRPDMAVYRFTDKISKGESIEIYGGLDTKRDYTFVSDIVDGIISSISIISKIKFEIINLGGSDPIRLGDLVRLIEKNTGKYAKLNIIEKQKGDVEITFADIDKAKRLLGYKPQVKIKEGIIRFIEWYIKES